MGAQLAGARLLYEMGRDAVIPKGFFGVIQASRHIPQNSVLFIGAVSLAGGFLMSGAVKG